MRIDRLPAIPLIASDPYFSVWMPADTMTRTDSIHWCGPSKPIRAELTADGVPYRFLGVSEAREAELTGLEVSATSTVFESVCGGVRVTARFMTPALPDDLDLLSMPLTLVEFTVVSADSASHDTALKLSVSDRMCWNGDIRPAMTSAELKLDGREAAWCGQLVQKPLCHSGDHITIDWGYLWLTGDGDIRAAGDGLTLSWAGKATRNPKTVRAILAYDDIASINYFGNLCKAWYRRGGAQITDAIARASKSFDAILKKGAALDARVEKDALAAGGEPYAQIIRAAWRHTFAAHKLIADADGRMVLLSKENDSNGCIGTVDVSYPSIPLFLKYCPEFVNALCRPVLAFADMPVWDYDFAPHDVGRYPNATGQVYAIPKRVGNGGTFPPYYLYPAGSDLYDFTRQMPVEECGNMLIMLAAAKTFGADPALGRAYPDTLKKWVAYLVRYGEDPGEQLCTDDFAGHLTHNVNLAAKAIVGVACYGILTGEENWRKKAAQMARRLTAKIGAKGDTPLTLDGKGWSMKYNLLWDRVLGLGLFTDAFYDAETASYVKRIERYGLPLDSRADYTKSDWICWTAALSADREYRRAMLEPMAAYLRETTTRVPFSDWYDTKTGRYEHFIARSVQGGLFALMLKHAAPDAVAAKKPSAKKTDSAKKAGPIGTAAKKPASKTTAKNTAKKAAGKTEKKPAKK